MSFISFPWLTVLARSIMRVLKVSELAQGGIKNQSVFLLSHTTQHFSYHILQQTLTGYPRIQFNSHIIYPEILSDPTGQVFSSTRQSHFGCQLYTPGCELWSDWPAMNQDSYHLLFMCKKFATVAHRTQGNALLMQINNQMEEMERTRYVGRHVDLPFLGRCRLYEHHPPGTITCSANWKVSESCPFQVFMKTLFLMHD